MNSERVGRDQTDYGGLRRVDVYITQFCDEAFDKYTLTKEIEGSNQWAVYALDRPTQTQC